ncbi:hypothetical protein M885DRAFT_578118 [Pelagophyceae sp. CCMP2097]|nr:hypothetical protein M885DRAFT_578118 [Pelagophyceae sp. CCMP2097]|mmetsp:Transcript_881/g.2843  ORF Transcript_881/g.2843 Transcript_881/m.2843 type:complete len:145 (-) Transcript_881:157-591(-)
MEDELRAAFALFDVSGKGVVDVTSLKSLFFALGVSTSKKEVRQQLQAAGIGDQPSLDFQEFAALAMPSVSRRVFMTDDAALFALLDVDSSGSINLDHLKQCREELGESLTDDELAEAVAEHGGGISLSAFEKMMASFRAKEADN